MSQIVFDENLAGQLESLYSKRDVLRRRSLVRDALDAQPGERILDVGCGPGFYVAELLEAVGAGGSVVGVDTSAPMLGVAARRCAGHANAEFKEGVATSLPVPDASFDAALSVQVLEYVPDVGAALAEMHRALRPGGRVLVWDVDWSTVSWYSRDPARMKRVLRAWDDHLTHPALPRTLAAQLRAAGFEEIRATGHTFASIELDPETYGAATMPLIAAYAAGQGSLGTDEAQDWEAEQRELGERGEFYFAVVQSCFTANRPG